jgi:hypothetical protein
VLWIRRAVDVATPANADVLLVRKDKWGGDLARFAEVSRWRFDTSGPVQALLAFADVIASDLAEYGVVRASPPTGLYHAAADYRFSARWHTNPSILRLLETSSTFWPMGRRERPSSSGLMRNAAPFPLRSEIARSSIGDYDEPPDIDRGCRC